MNPHYHHPPYPDLNSPHSPNSDGVPNNYHGHGGPQGGPPNGHVMNSHHEHMHQHPAFTGGPISHHGNGPNSLQNYHHHHHHHHHLINHNSNSNNNNGNNNTSNSNQLHMNAVCAACGAIIKDRWIFKALDRHWHSNCLKCHCCGVFLADMGSCFTKDNMILCKNDYVKMFGTPGACAACGLTIPAHEMVMRAGVSSVSASPANASFHQVFHLQCFACSKCGTKLVAGDRYHLLGGNLVCEQDWHKLLKASTMPPGQPQTTGTTIRKGKVGRPRRSRD